MMTDAAVSMQRLLDFPQVSQEEVKCQPLPVDGVIEAVRVRLAGGACEFGASITYGILPVVILMFPSALW